MFNLEDKDSIFYKVIALVFTLLFGGGGYKTIDTYQKTLVIQEKGLSKIDKIKDEIVKLNINVSTLMANQTNQNEKLKDVIKSINKLETRILYLERAKIP